MIEHSIINNNINLALEIEELILQKISYNCFRLNGWGDESLGKEDKDKIKKILINAVSYDFQPFTTALATRIFYFLALHIKKGVFPSALAIVSGVCAYKPFSEKPEQTKKQIFDLLMARKISLFENYSLAELSAELLKLQAEARIKNISEEISEKRFLTDDLLKQLEQSIVTIQARNSPLTPEKTEYERIAEYLKSVNIEDSFQRAVAGRTLRETFRLNHQESLEILDSCQSVKRASGEVTRVVDFLKQDLGGAEFLFAGLVPLNGVTLVTGLPGAGKTLLAYEMIFSFLNNEEFAGEKPCFLAQKPSRRALIINSDQQPTEAQSMLAAMHKVLRSGDRCDIINDFNLGRMDELETWCAMDIHDVILIDSYIGIHSHNPKFDENSSSAHLAINYLRRLAAQYHKTFIVIHHSPKDTLAKGITKARGSVHIVSQASAHLNVSKIDDPMNPNAKLRALEVAKIRNCPQREPIHLELDEITLSHNVVKGGTEKETNNVCDYILQMFQRKQRMSKEEAMMDYDEILNNLSTNDRELTRKRVYKAVDNLERRGEIVKEAHPDDYKKKILKIKPRPDSFYSPQYTDDQSLNLIAQMNKQKANILQQQQHVLTPDHQNSANQIPIDIEF